jgi:hypothetical protein
MSLVAMLLVPKEEHARKPRELRLLEMVSRDALVGVQNACDEES